MRYDCPCCGKLWKSPPAVVPQAAPSARPAQHNAELEVKRLQSMVFWSAVIGIVFWPLWILTVVFAIQLNGARSRLYR